MVINPLSEMFKVFVLKHLIDAYLTHIILLIFPSVYFVQVQDLK